MFELGTTDDRKVGSASIELLDGRQRESSIPLGE
jgi:hypothetical protein